MLQEGVYNPENAATLKELQLADTRLGAQNGGGTPLAGRLPESRPGSLSGYLGTDLEQEYDQLENVLTQFKAGQEKVWLKRLGNEDADLWYDEKDFSQIDVLVLEWTHGNSGKFEG